MLEMPKHTCRCTKHNAPSRHPPASRRARRPRASPAPAQAPRAAGMRLRPRPEWLPPLRLLVGAWRAQGPAGGSMRQAVQWAATQCTCTCVLCRRYCEPAGSHARSALGVRRAKAGAASTNWEGVGTEAATGHDARQRKPQPPKRSTNSRTSSTHQVCGRMINGGVIQPGVLLPQPARRQQRQQVVANSRLQHPAGTNARQLHLRQAGRLYSIHLTTNLQITHSYTNSYPDQAATQEEAGASPSSLRICQRQHHRSNRHLELP